MSARYARSPFFSARSNTPPGLSSAVTSWSLNRPRNAQPVPLTKMAHDFMFGTAESRASAAHSNSYPTLLFSSLLNPFRTSTPRNCTASFCRAAMSALPTPYSKRVAPVMTPRISERDCAIAIESSGVNTRRLVRTEARMQMPLYREVRPVVIIFIDTGGALLRDRGQGLAAERPLEFHTRGGLKPSTGTPAWSPCALLRTRRLD
ncbi:unnamed protein product [Chondrus crispus]|uniref:Uncharacterized protein n=1 Tax=Chondrus crispus TaxID=2769 RepID=R7QGQ5_CHOCR|nr:unnamed protein product [Chondrus crispus]CDF37269.1 unnamed protein product [Chondrus crispus]|eukprot:XP_005717088.1 unnamed protein product [Chondrus crispus]